MNRPYLTDWEFYIVFCNYYKPQEIELKFNVYENLKKYNQLPSLYILPFFNISSHVHHTTPQPVNDSYWEGIPYKQLSFKSNTAFKQWLKEYLLAYRQNLLQSTKKYEKYTSSLEQTATFLRRTAIGTKSDIVTFTSQVVQQVNSISGRKPIRFYEDLLVLLQEEYIQIVDVRLENSNILEDKFQKGTVPLFTLDLTFLKPLRERDIAILQSTSTFQSISTTPTVSQQIFPDLQNNTRLQDTKHEPIIHTIDYKRDFLPSDCMLVLLALYKTGNYIFLSKKSTQLLQIIKQMPFLKIATGSDKHIRSKISKFHSIPQKFNIPKSDEITCIILTKKESLNEYLKNYLDRYQQDKLNNHSHYCLYNESWDRTIRMLNSLRAENGENYCITPGTIENKKTILNTRTSWIECLLILIRSGQIQLTEANLEWGHSLNFSLGITQASEIPLVKNALCEHLGISITLDNKVQYKGYPVHFQANSRKFMFLKFLLLNKGANGRNMRIVAQFFVKEYQKLGIEIDETKITDNKLTAYQNAINKKFESISKKVPLDFWITAGKTENKLEPLSSKTLKRSRKRQKKSPRNL